MGRYATKGSGDFEDAPIGTHVATCIRLIDIGTHESEYQGKTSVRNQVFVQWELPNTLMSDGRPFVVGKFYTNSLNEKANLRHDLEAWRGRPFTAQEEERFDLEAILGKACLVGVTAKPSGGTRVGGVLALPKGTKVPPPQNDVFAFWIEEWDQEKFDRLGKGIQAMIERSHERTGKAAPVGGGGGSVDIESDVPF
jgi:hypothetical protein